MADDAGLFGPGSVTWRIHAHPAMLVGGLRALIIHALEPRAMAAVDRYSGFRSDPWGRLRRTSDYVTTTTFGDRAAAEAAGARVRAIHARVRGIDPHSGRSYRADDPELLAWVHNVEVHSFLVAYRSYAGRVSRRDGDRYVAEMVAAAELVGLSAGQVPSDEAGLRRALRAAPLAATPEAHEALRLLLVPPLPPAARPLWTVLAAGALALLPPRVRAAYRLPWFAPAVPGVHLAAFAALRTMKLVLPPPLPLRDARARAVA